MSETLIARTYAEGLRPLGASAQRNHALITDAVAARLSPAHALLVLRARDDARRCRNGLVRPGKWCRAEARRTRFPKRVRPPEGGLANWSGTSSPLRMNSKPGVPKPTGVSQRRCAMPPRCRTATAIWLVGDQPVLVTWAHSRDIDKAPRGIIRTFIPAKPPPPTPSSTGTPTGDRRDARAPDLPGRALVVRLACSGGARVLGLLAACRALCPSRARFSCH